MKILSGKPVPVIAACAFAFALASMGETTRAEAADTATLAGKPAKTFSTAGHPKSSGVALTISYPEDWNAEESKSRTGVQMFVNPTSTATVMVGAKPSKRPITPEEAAKLVADGTGVSPLFPPSTSIVNFQSVKVGDVPAALVECTDSRKQADAAAHARSFFLIFVQGDVLVMIHCMVASPDPAAVEKTFESHRELFKQILSSVTLANGLK
ncbi:hypothetical protein DES53_104495 [Roseimicrobium gellanilyticum]|uniref:PsbP C-terminal domain-containing protein n=1 Tax=Roseimicrobium gellanilyticum TaxID=748857 RepID=A0A366HNA9_9BACT|nr:hypothetical protein [Roseimicrobium gellanilyticum]RBP44672.1 hypothetical protein DES53_104495 [Roseimicrobium gellanilyticum]